MSLTKALAGIDAVLFGYGNRTMPMAGPIDYGTTAILPYRVIAPAIDAAYNVHAASVLTNMIAASA